MKNQYMGVIKYYYMNKLNRIIFYGEEFMIILKNEQIIV